jgi:hypothetical protein
LPSFGPKLRLALLLPMIIAVSAWLAQWYMRFPQGSFGASVTAKMSVLPLLVEALPVPIAITRLARHASLRSFAAIAITALATVFLLIGILVMVALLA